jgi:hypothetical protein
MIKYQTPYPDVRIIEGSSPESAIRALRVKNEHTDSYYDISYNWTIHSDNFHLVSNNQ